METHKENSVPIVKNFQRPWEPITPLKPEVPQFKPPYAVVEESEMEAFLSRFSHPNQEPHQFLSSSSNNNHLWDVNHGGQINLQQRENNIINHIEMQKRGLENYLPPWNNHPPPQQPPQQPPAGAQAQSNFPWDALRWKINEDPLSHLTSFTDLLAIKGNSMENAAFYSVNHPTNNTSFNGGSMFFNHNDSHLFNQQMRDIFGEEMQNCGSLHQYQSVCDANSPQTNTSAKISKFAPANFAPATPDSRWKNDNMGLENTPSSVFNQASAEQVFQEQDIAAAMISLQNAVDAAPDTDSLAPEQVAVADDTVMEEGQVIDLNKTPQKKTRRRRYQPKVLSEKKPRKTPKSKIPNPTETKETPQGKRKYVRKNKVDTNKTPATPPGEANEAGETKSTGVNEAGDTKPAETAAKSCRRSLNFNLNRRAADSNFPSTSNGDADVKAQEKCDTEINQNNFSGNHGQGVELVVEASRGGIAYDLNCALDQELENYPSVPSKDYLNNSQPNSNILSKRKQNTPHTLSGNSAEILSTKNSPHAAQSPNSSPCASSSEQKNRRGSKRRNPYIGDVDGIVDPTLCTIWQTNHALFGNGNIGELPKFLPEICKKKRTEKVQRSHIPSTSFSAPGDVNPVANAPTYPRVDPSASKYYCCNHSAFGIDGVPNSNHANALMETNQNGHHLINTWADLAMLKKKRSKGTTRVRDLAQWMGIASVQPVKPRLRGPRKKKIDISEDAYTDALAARSTATPRSKRRSKKQISENKLDLVVYNGYIPALTWAKGTSSVEDLTEWMKQLDISKENCNSDLKERIQEELLLEQKNALVPYRARKQQKNALVPYCARKQQNNALVPYRARKQQNNTLVVYGRNGTMVPFEGPFDPVRKRRQRAKVDLDDETTNVWKLLLENIDNEGIDGTDEDKAKWWENERSIFRGRVDSFIARMRLVQGDRRFTPWKGSVLDSVIGVFLTQNVSDHLSSSAFMSLASHFPLKSEGSENTLSEESITALVEEPDICVIEPEESNSWNEKTINKQILTRNFRIIHDIEHIEEKEVGNSEELTGRAPGSVSPKDSSESSQKTFSSTVSNANCQTTDIERASILRDERAKDDATSSQHSVLSSQNSTSSPYLHNVGMMSFSSESDSRTQPLTTSSQSNYLDCPTSFLGLLKMAESPFLQESYNQRQRDSLECMKHVTKGFPEAQGTGSSNYLNLSYQFPNTKGFEMLEVDSKSPNTSRIDENSTLTEQSNLTIESSVQHLTQEKSSDSVPRSFIENESSCYVLEGEKMVMHSPSINKPSDTLASSPNGQTSSAWESTKLSQVNADVTESTTGFKGTSYDHKEVDQVSAQTYPNSSKSKRGNAGKGKNVAFDWDSLRREAQPNGQKKERTANTRDSLDWEAVRHADRSEIAEVIKARGMNNMLAERIKELLDRLVKEHGSIDMEWLRDIPPDKAKEYLLSFRGLGLKSVECVRLLTLHHLAFPVDTNVGRIAVRLGWVPLQPLPESLQLHLLELYPILESIQKYLWPRLCKLDQRTLYELHYHLITFGKVFCTKKHPNCNACPLRAECRHFASAFASARFALPGPEEKSITTLGASSSTHTSSQARSNILPLPAGSSNQHSQNNPLCVNSVPTIEASPSPLVLPLPQTINHLERQSETTYCEPIVEVPASPEPEQEQEQTVYDIEDNFDEDPNEIPTISLNMKELSQTIQKYVQTGETNALVALTPEAASIPTPKLKNINQLRTEHHVYELPDTHTLLKGLDKREPDDPCPYLLAIWTPGETADSIQPPERICNSEDPRILCHEVTCSYCNSLREANSQIVRGTLLIPCRTAMRGSFPLNGTYFQVNEVFADHNSSINPLAVPRSWLWNLPRRTVYFGTSIPTIFKGLTTEDIQLCFWRGFVCVRGFDWKTRAPRPLMARLHFPASKKRDAKGRVYDE